MAESASYVQASGDNSEVSDRVFDFSAAQRGIWFAQQLAGDVPINIAQYVEVDGTFDVEVLNRASVEVGKQFGSGFLRIVEVDGDQYQRVDRDIEDSVTYIDLRGESDPMSVAITWMRNEYGSPVDLTADRLVVSYVLQVGADHYLWYCRIHHIALDGYGAMAMMTRTAERYGELLDGRESLAPEVGGLAKIVEHEATYRSSKRFTTDREYWQEKTEGLPEPLSLAGRTAPLTMPARVDGGNLSTDVTDQLEKLVMNYNSSTAPVVVAAFAGFLARMTGASEVVLSLPVSARTTAWIRRSGGMVSNVVPLRIPVDADATIGELTTLAQTELTGALRRQRYRHEDIRRDRGEASNHLGLFGPSINIMMFHNEIRLGPTVGKFNVLTTGPVEDLALNLYPGVAGQSIRIDFEGNPNLYSRADLSSYRRRFVDYLDGFLTIGVDGLSRDIELLDEQELRELVPARGPAGREPILLTDLLRAAARNPSATAVVSDGTRLTYGELDEQSNRLARELISRGAGPERFVVLALPRSVDHIVAVWAVAKTGAAFLPVDPAYPRQRIERMVADSEAVAGLTNGASIEALPEQMPWLVLDDPETRALCAAQSSAAIADTDRNASIRAENPAYGIYTSGSTGRPKGVVVTHTGLANLIAEMQENLGVTAESRCLAVASPSFDVSVFEMLLAFASGSTLVVSPSTVFGGAELAELLRRERVTHATITPSVLASTDPTGLDDLEVLVTAGEACSAELVVRWGTDRKMHNYYGPAESTICTNSTAPMVPGAPVAVGPPVFGVSQLVLDARLRPVPVGVAGELYTAGVGIGRGYHNRFEQTADRFVANPYGTPGERMYRTGDVVRWNADLAIEFLGRADFQVKIRGFRIELGEIDSVLSSHPDVEMAVTVTHLNELGQNTLVSYVVQLPGAMIEHDDLVRYATKKLPGYMVPAVVMVLDQMPLTANGKVDRSALPDPVFEVREFRAPTNPIEEIVATVLAEVLGLDRVGLDDDFFALGGNSLIATKVVARLGAALHTKLSVRTLFEASTVVALAERMKQESGGVERPELVAGPRPDQLPLSLAQQRLWFLNQFEPESVAYNIPFAIRLSGDVDVAALQSAVLDVLARHESLRTIYPDSEQGPHQVIMAASSVVSTLQAVPIAEADLAAQLITLAAKRFDVTSAVPLCAKLFELGPNEHVLAIVVQHIAADGASMAPLARDVMVAYGARAAGQAPSWPPLAVQYADYSLWQREVLGSETDPESLISEQLAYWADALAGLPDHLELPTDRPRPAVISQRGAAHDFTIPAELHRRLIHLSRIHHATLFMVVHAALAALMARLSNSRDIVIGTPIAGRGEAALDDVIGMFVNTLVLRTDVDGTGGFTGLLNQAREVDLTAFGHSEVSFERLVEVLNPVRSQSRHPLFQVMLAFQNMELSHFELTGLTAAAVEFDHGVSKFDLQLTLAGSIDEQGVPGGMTARFTYATDLFDASTVEGFADRFLRILEAVVGDPAGPLGDIELMSDRERDVVVRQWNSTDHPYPDATLVSLFEAQAVRSPAATAVVFGTEELTYAELASKVNRLARFLISQGVGPDSLVGVSLHRSLDLIVAVYAVLAAGGTYVPVDPDHPRERVLDLLATVNPVGVIATSGDRQVESAGLPVWTVDSLDLIGFGDQPISQHERTATLRSSNTAYVIHTSGSTGRPKGVAVTHAAIVNQMLWRQHEYRLGESDVAVQKTPFTFDVAVWEFFWPLMAGAKLVIARPDGHREPDYLSELMTAHAVTVVHFVPSMLELFRADTSAQLPASLRLLFSGGEAIRHELAEALRRKGDYTLHNLYGPAEAAVDVTFHEVTDRDVATVPMGKGVWNTQLLVLDSRLRPVPAGVAGELYLAGAQLARGYLGRRDLTAERFVANPYGAPGARMYRSGDLVRWNTDMSAEGELNFLGRIDFQVKLRGQRIELGEVESALLANDAVAQVVVVVHDGEHGQRLVGYVVPAGPGEPDATELLDLTRMTLPSYMVPAQLVMLAALPITASGKLDRRALPEPEFVARTFRAPGTDAEKAVAEVFAEVLGADQVGLDDDFFDLGGNSLIATRVVARLGAALDAEVPIRTLFEASTVAGLSARIDAGSGRARKGPVAGPRPERVALSLAQQRMWLLNRFDPDSPIYNMPLALRMSGTLDVEALHTAVVDVLTRHESLRTKYPEVGGVAHQVTVPVEQVIPDLTPVQVTADEVHQRFVEFATAGFEVTAAPPIRLRLFRVDEAEHVLAVVAHHISADGFSRAPLSRDLMAAYVARSQGNEPAWEPLPVQYADFALWQRAELGSEDDAESEISRQLNFWRSTLAGAPEQLNLPTDRPRRAEPSHLGASVPLKVEPDVLERLKVIGRERNATLFMVIHSALAVLLSRMTGSGDVTIGTATAGRGEAELDGLVGMFVNTLALRTPVDAGASFTALLGQVRDRDLSAFAHADVPFEQVVDVVGGAPSRSRHPLFQTALAFQNLDAVELALPDLTVGALDGLQEPAKFDLQLTVAAGVERDVEWSQGLVAAFTYATDLFDEATVTRFADRFVRILRAVSADPAVVVGDIEIHGDAERAAMHTSGVGGPGDAAARPTSLDRALPDMFMSTVESDPDAPAVAFGEDELAYRDLDARSNRLCRVLIGRGVGPGDQVAIGLPRSVDYVVALWAVVKAGAAVVVADPAAKLIVGARTGITESRLIAGLPADVEWLSLDAIEVRDEIAAQKPAPVSYTERVRTLAADDPAFLLTGLDSPHGGLALTHRELSSVIAALRVSLEVTYESRTFSSEQAIEGLMGLEVLVAGAAGAAVVIADDGDASLADRLAEGWVTHVFASEPELLAVAPAELEDLEVAVVNGGPGEELRDAWGSRPRVRSAGDILGELEESRRARG